MITNTSNGDMASVDGCRGRRRVKHVDKRFVKAGLRVAMCRLGQRRHTPLTTFQSTSEKPVLPQGTAKGQGKQEAGLSAVFAAYLRCAPGEAYLGVLSGLGVRGEAGRVGGVGPSRCTEVADLKDKVGQESSKILAVLPLMKQVPARLGE